MAARSMRAELTGSMVYWCRPAEFTSVRDGSGDSWLMPSEGRKHKEQENPVKHTWKLTLHKERPPEFLGENMKCGGFFIQNKPAWITFSIPTSGFKGVVVVFFKIHSFLLAARIFHTIILGNKDRGGDESGVCSQITRMETYRHDNLWLTLGPDEDFESKAAPSSSDVADWGCEHTTRGSNQKLQTSQG